LCTIARLGNDAKSLEIAWRELMDGAAHYEHIQRQLVTELPKLAAVGHMPALLNQKQLLLQTEASPQLIAQAVLIEESVRSGNIPIRVGLSKKDSAESARLDSSWRDLIMNNRDSVITELKKPLKLPEHSYFDKALHHYYVKKEILKYSKLNTDEDYERYVLTTLADYTKSLAIGGIDMIPALLQRTRDVSPIYMDKKKERAELSRQEAVNRYYPIVRAIVGKFDKNRNLKAFRSSLEARVPEINRLLLMRAVTVAATRLAKS
jgi:hypothetical protein